MNFPLTMIDLAGTVALLLWGMRMVQTGVQRGLGLKLRRIMEVALRNRFKAFLAGVGVTAILQSSTATGLMVAGFAAGVLVELVPALAVMLGANIGTTLIVQVLSFDMSGLAPCLFLIGVVMFRRSEPSLKAWHFASSDRGGERAAAMYSLIVTAKLNCVDPCAWLADVLARIADHPVHKIDEFMPWNWKAQSAKMAA